jgi:hypothetical protein
MAAWRGFPKFSTPHGVSDCVAIKSPQLVFMRCLRLKDTRSLSKSNVCPLKALVHQE